jgi:hypothetical protein
MATHLGGLVLEADADGGVLSARYSAWLDEQAPTLEYLLGALHSYAGIAHVEDRLQHLPGGARAVFIPPDAESALTPVTGLVDDLEDLRQDFAGETLVLDVGRVRPESPAMSLAEQADALIAVVRPNAESLSSLMARLPGLLQRVRRLVVAVRGDGAYAVADIREALAQQAGSRIAVVAVPEDAHGVQILIGNRKGGWSSWGSERPGTLRYGAGVLVMLLNRPGPEEERATLPPVEDEQPWGAIRPATRFDERTKRRWPEARDG